MALARLLLKFWTLSLSCNEGERGSHLLEWLSSKRKKVTSIDEGMEEREPLFTVGENVS